jgi:hypothetical protein
MSPLPGLQLDNPSTDGGILNFDLPRRKQPNNHPQHAEVVFAPFGPDRSRVPLQPCAFEGMSSFIGVFAGAAAPNHIRDAGIRARTSPCIMARCSTITSGTAANEIVVHCWFINNGNDCVWAIDEETGAVGDEVRHAQLAALDRVGALN